MSCVYIDWQDPDPTSQYKRMTHANRCIYKVIPPDDEQ